MSDPGKTSCGRHRRPVRWRWVWGNRQARERSSALGALAEKVAGAAAESAADQVEEVAEALAAIADDEFCRFCTVGRVSGGQVTLLVSDAEMLYHIRVHWHLAVREHLARACRSVVVRRVLFRTGSGGLPIAGPEPGVADG